MSKKKLMVTITSIVMVTLIAGLVMPLVSASGQDADTGETPLTATVSAWMAIHPVGALETEVDFGSLDPGTTGNAALGNADGSNGYQIDVDDATNQPVDMYHKLSEQMATNEDWFTVYSNVTVNESGGWSETSEFDDAGWTEIGNEAGLWCDSVYHDGETYITEADHCRQMFYIDVADAVEAGTYEVQYEFCGVLDSEDSSAC